MIFELMISLMLVMMQLALSLSKKSLRLHLKWRPREENTHADDLTNERFHNFDTDLRIPILWREVDTTLLDSLLLHADSYCEELASAKSKRLGSHVSGGHAKKRVKTSW